MNSVYGNAPEGEHLAVVRTTNTEKFPGGLRFIVGFLIVDQTGTEPLCNDAGEPFFAVAVCNPVKKGTAKSKQFKIRKAMLLTDEYDPIASATSVPNWDHFINKRPDGTYRTVRIRIGHQLLANGGVLSLVTHIQRPRDSVWESIEGKLDGADSKFDGAPFLWVNMDGTQKPLSLAERERMSALENTIYEFWSACPYQDQRWFTSEGNFKLLARDAVDGLPQSDRAHYEVARGKAALERNRRGP